MLLNLLELASNKTLEHDPATQTRLVKLQGKTMALNIKTLNQSLAVTPHPSGLEFSSTIPQSVDVTLTATVGAMIKITRDGMEDAELEPGELEIMGDPIIGQRFAQVMSELNVDWHSLIAEQIGDGPAHVVTTAADQAKDFAKTSQSHFKQMLSKLIKDDMDVVVDKEEVNAFLDDVDTLRADADRLIARIKRLQSKQ